MTARVTDSAVIGASRDVDALEELAAELAPGLNRTLG